PVAWSSPMYAPRFLPTTLSLLASGAVALFAGAAHAGQSCTVDTDCEHGFTCQTNGISACPAIACAPNTDCPQPFCPPPSKECVPGPCNAHSDCADGMVCYQSEQKSCTNATAPACPPNADCPALPPPPPPECTVTTTRSCVPRYLLPCTNDAGCGEGFN